MFSFQLYAKVSFPVPERKGSIENNFGPSVKLSDNKNQMAAKSKMAANFQLFIALPLITFVLLNINRDFWSLYIRLHV